MSTFIESLPPPTTIKGVPPLRCIYREADLKLALRQGAIAGVLLDSGLCLLPAALLDRGDGVPSERVYQACLMVLALHAEDVEAFARSGFGAPWAADFRKVTDAFYRRFREEQAAGFQTEAALHFQVSATEEAALLTRRIHALLHNAKLGGILTYLSADRGSLNGLQNAAWEILAKGKQPEVATRLRQAGVTEAMIARLSELYDELNQVRELRTGEAAAYGDRVLRALKAMLLGEISLLSGAARAELDPARAEKYQVGRLLETARPPERRDPPQPTPGPAPTPEPARPAPTPEPARPAPTPEPARPLLSPVTGTDSRPPTASAFDLKPGTVLTRLEVRGGPALLAVVQPDGKPTWVPEVTDQPAATPPPQPVTAQPPPPRRSRRR